MAMAKLSRIMLSTKDEARIISLADDSVALNMIYKPNQTPFSYYFEEPEVIDPREISWEVCGVPVTLLNWHEYRNALGQLCFRAHFQVIPDGPVRY